MDYESTGPAHKHVVYPPDPPKEWVGLTKEEAAECWSTSAVKTWKAIEAKLKEKNGAR